MPLLGETLSIGAALCWAVGVILFKRSGETIPPLALNLFKNVLALVLLTPTIPLLGESLAPDQTARAWILLLVSGFLGIAVADTLFFVSLDRLGAGLTAVVDTSYTPIMLSLSYVFLGEEIGWHVLVGGGLVVSAMLVGAAARPERGRTRRDIAVGMSVGVTGIFLMGASIVMIKDVLNDAPMLWATWVRLLAGALGLVPIALLHPQRRALFAALGPNRAWRYAAPAAVVGTYLAMVMWIGGMKHADVSVASILNQLSTIFIFALATVVLGEPLTPRRIAAIALAFSGALLVTLR